MLFKHAFHPAIAAGTITSTYRAWHSARVKVGNTYRLNAAGVIAVDEVRKTRLAEISEADALASGFASRDGLLEQLVASRDHHPASTVFRVRFHYLPAPHDPFADVSADVSAEELRALMGRLKNMDARSRTGPWTDATLALIDAQPRVGASQLAPRLGMETPQFKSSVRKLKGLGLTISYGTGYGLTSLGSRVLREGAS